MKRQVSALGAVILAGSGTEVTWRRWFLPIVSIAYLIGAAQVQRQVGPEGDEPHYLMVADSLLRDHDLSLEPDYALGRYRAFHPSPLWCPSLMGMPAISRQSHA